LNKIVELARNAIELYVKEKKKLLPDKKLLSEIKGVAGVFVSIKKDNALRGCIGTFAPTTDSIVEEIIRNAIEAATFDPRFPPVTKEELPYLKISVDILTDPVPVHSVSELDSKRFGVIVKAQMRRGLLLPDLEGVNTPEEQIEICRRKGGIGKDEAVELFKFEVKRYK